MWEVSVGGTTSAHGARNDLVARSYSVGLSPSYGYFVTDCIEILGAVGIDYEETVYKKTATPLELDYSKQEDYSVAAGLQYNLDGQGPVVPFVRTYIGLVNSRRAIAQRNIPVVGQASDRRKATDPYFGFRGGMRYFVDANVSCDIGLGWKRILFEKDFGGTTDDFSLVIGCAIFF